MLVPLLRFCCLRVYVCILVGVNRLYLLLTFDDNCLAVGLSYKTQHFGMSGLAVDDNLPVIVGCFFPFPLYPLLQLEYDRACGIDELKVVLFCYGICQWRFTMCPKENFCIMQLPVLPVVYGDESEFL